MLSPEAKADSDSVSPFLRLLKHREQKDPQSVAVIYSQLKPAIDFVANNQHHFEADIDVYDDFKVIAEEIGQLGND